MVDSDTLVGLGGLLVASRLASGSGTDSGTDGTDDTGDTPMELVLYSARVANQGNTLASGPIEAMPFDTVMWEIPGGTTGPQPNQFSAPVDGLYEVTAEIEVDISGVSQAGYAAATLETQSEGRVAVNSDPIHPLPGEGWQSLKVSADVPLREGATVIPKVTQRTDTTVSIPSEPFNTRFRVHWIGPHP